jgi:hypothetical protein
MVLSMMVISKTAEVVLAAGAIALLAMAVFGLDSIVFSKKRTIQHDPHAPKQRVKYIVEDAEEEPEEPGFSGQTGKVTK